MLVPHLYWVLHNAIKMLCIIDKFFKLFAKSVFIPSKTIFALKFVLNSGDGYKVFDLNKDKNTESGSTVSEEWKLIQ